MKNIQYKLNTNRVLQDFRNVLTQSHNREQGRKDALHYRRLLRRCDDKLNRRGKTSKDDEAWAAMGLLYLGCLDEAHEAMMIIRQTAHRNKLITALYFLNQKVDFNWPADEELEVFGDTFIDAVEDLPDTVPFKRGLKTKYQEFIAPENIRWLEASQRMVSFKEVHKPLLQTGIVELTRILVNDPADRKPAFNVAFDEAVARNSMVKDR